MFRILDRDDSANADCCEDVGPFVWRGSDFWNSPRKRKRPDLFRQDRGRVDTIALLLALCLLRKVEESGAELFHAF